VTPQVTVSGRRSGRLSVAGLIAMRPGSRTRLCHRLRTHPSGKGGRRSIAERDFIALIDAPISSSKGRSCWCGTA
jgi:putative transposase